MTRSARVLLSALVLLVALPAAGFEPVRVWVASSSQSESVRYLAVFNIGDKALDLHTSLEKLGFSAGSSVQRDLWKSAQLPKSDRLEIVLPAHGCILYSVITR